MTYVLVNSIFLPRTHSIRPWPIYPFAAVVQISEGYQVGLVYPLSTTIRALH